MLACLLRDRSIDWKFFDAIISPSPSLAPFFPLPSTLLPYLSSGSFIRPSMDPVTWCQSLASRRAPSSESCCERRGCADAIEASHDAADESLIFVVLFEVSSESSRAKASVARDQEKERERGKGRSMRLGKRKRREKEKKRFALFFLPAIDEKKIE